MATLLGNNVYVYGSYYARIRIEWQLASQNIAGNYSTINWQAYVDFIGCDAQLDDGYVGWNGGALYDNGGRIYNWQNNNSNHTIGMGSGSFNVGHDSAGNASFSMNGDVYVYESGRTSASGSWGLPNIPRYASIPYFEILEVTDQKIRFGWTSSDNVNYISWWSNAYDGGGHHDIPASGTGMFTITLDNLVSQKQYDFTVAVRRADSGLWTSSGTKTATTRSQNNFFAFLC